MTAIRIDRLETAFATHRPRLVPVDEAPRRAAVALLLRPGDEDLDILLIERPHNEDDPWSGHMAFPGGRRDAGEEDVDTAIRETAEEVGIDLRAGAHLIGRLDDVRPARGGPQIAVAAFVFAVPDDTLVRPDPREVATAIWIPLDHLVDPQNAAEHLHPVAGGAHVRFPAVGYDGYIIWGLTYRMLTQFLQIARTISDEPIP